MNTGYVYCIYCKDTDKKYIGSTTHDINKRLSQHKYNYNRYINKNGSCQNLLYCSSYEVLEHDNYNIICLEVVNYENKKDLYNKEKLYIKNMDCVNKNIPNRKFKEYYKDNKDKYKQYYKDNRERIIKYNKEQYKNKIEYYTEKAKEYRKNNPELFKKYYEKNKEKLKEYGRDNYNKKKEYYLTKNKEWQKQNKERVDELNKLNRNRYKSIIYVCPCTGKNYTKSTLYQHLKSIKHVKYCNNTEHDIIIKCNNEDIKDIIIPSKITSKELNNIV